jgi:hypothetical protein
MLHPATQLAATTNDTNTMLRLTLIVSRLLESNGQDKNSLCRLHLSQRDDRG